MRTVAKACFTAVLGAAIITASVTAVEALPILVTYDNDNTGVENVLMTSDDLGALTVHGTVNSGLFDVYFNSDSGNGMLDAPSSGQARVSGADGNDPFTDLFFYLGAGETFTKAVFNVNVADEGHIRGDMQIIVDYTTDGGTPFQETVEVDWNGENYFTVAATEGYLISQIRLVAVGEVSFEDLRQIRLGGFGDDPDNEITAVPEPASMVLFGSGLAGLAAARKRRNGRR